MEERGFSFSGVAASVLKIKKPLVVQTIMDLCFIQGFHPTGARAYYGSLWWCCRHDHVLPL